MSDEPIGSVLTGVESRAAKGRARDDDLPASQAREWLLAWLLDLPDSVDPAQAAAGVLARMNPGQGQATDFQRELEALLRLVARCPAASLAVAGRA